METEESLRLEIRDQIMEVHTELTRANSIHPQFNSPHEGYAVLLEEVDELWQEIKHGTKEQIT